MSRKPFPAHICNSQMTCAYSISQCAWSDSHSLVQDGLGLAAEHGFFFRRAGSLEWDTRSSVEEMSWRSIVGPILQQYTESTDGSYVEKKESAFVWHYAAADPDFGSLQVTHMPSHSSGLACVTAELSLNFPSTDVFGFQQSGQRHAGAMHCSAGQALAADDERNIKEA